MIKIVVDDNIPYIRERLEGKADFKMLAPHEINHDSVKDADVLAVRTRTRCDSSLLDKSKVKLVVTATIGKDHIDTVWCEAHGIETSNAAGCNSPAVAQYVVATLSKAGFDPARHILGVVGKGHIGSIVTRIVRDAGGKVLVSDPPRHEKGYMDEVYIPLETLLKECDAVTFHVPLAKRGRHATKYLLNPSNAGLLKENAIVINASRGGVVDESVILNNSGNSIKWIIDTWENEPSINLELADKVFIATPHIAGYSEEGKQRATRKILDVINNKFDIGADVSGLADYNFDPGAFSFSEIASSYDPFADMATLKADLMGFEKIRDSYIFRPEPTV